MERGVRALNWISSRRLPFPRPPRLGFTSPGSGTTSGSTRCCSPPAPSGGRYCRARGDRSMNRSLAGGRRSGVSAFGAPAPCTLSRPSRRGSGSQRSIRESSEVPMKAQAILIAHLPLLRLERNEDLRFGDGLLTKLPWDQFDDLTQRAFSDWKRKYLGTDPCLLLARVGGRAALRQAGRCPGHAGDEAAARIVADPAAGPGAGAVVDFPHAPGRSRVGRARARGSGRCLCRPPRNSMTFLLPVGDSHFEIGGQAISGVRLQGDADMELAYLPDAAHEPLNDAALERARPLVPLARFAFDYPVAGPALRQFLTCGDLTLADPEVLLLAVAALESLFCCRMSPSGAAECSRGASRTCWAPTTRRGRVSMRSRGASIGAGPRRSTPSTSSRSRTRCPRSSARRRAAVAGGCHPGGDAHAGRRLHRHAPPNARCHPRTPPPAVEPLDASPVGCRVRPPAGARRPLGVGHVFYW